MTEKEKDAELSILRAIIGDANSKSVMRREVAQGRVEAWLEKRDAEVAARASERERLRDAVIEAVKADKCPRAFSANVTYALAALQAHEAKNQEAKP